MQLSLPPLRQRRSDIPLLVSYFWSRYAERQNGKRCHLSPRAMEALCQYAWPGNIRELENAVRQLLVLNDSQIIEPEDLPIPVPIFPKSSPALSFNQARAEAIAQFEKSYIAELLRTNGGNVTHAAQEAKKERRSFGRLIKKHRLEKR